MAAPEGKAITAFGQNLGQKKTISLPGGGETSTCAVVVNRTLVVRATDTFGNNVGELSGGGTGRMQYEIQPRYPNKRTQMFANGRKMYDAVAPNGMIRVEMTSNPASVVVTIGGKTVLKSESPILDVIFHCPDPDQ